METRPAAASHNENTIDLPWGSFRNLCKYLAGVIPLGVFDGIYGIPTGGWFVAAELEKLLNLPLVHTVGNATLVVDDIVDTGRTIAPYVFKGCKVASVFLRTTSEVIPTYHAEKCLPGRWVKFPWDKEREIEESIVRALEYIGEDASREGLKSTPARVVRSWEKLYGGYKQNVCDILRPDVMFAEHGEYDQIILLKDIEFFSMCEHHMLPFYGKVSIGYLPDKKVVGISKLARVVECFARRLQIQERMTQSIADALESSLQPRGLGVIVEAQHLCMMMRGVERKNATMVTSSVRGVFKEAPVKDEFLRMVEK